MNRLSQLQTYLAEAPNDPFLQYALALEYLKIKQDSDALAVFTTLTKQHPNYVGTYYHLGKLQEKMEMYDEALDTYEQGIIIAQKVNDHHTRNELQGAFNMLNDELSDDW
jgi:tetratricopeptide (TPR) repeat protein